MPYLNEKANPYGYSDILEDKLVLERLNTFKSYSRNSKIGLYEQIDTRPLSALSGDATPIDFAIAVDGSLSVLKGDARLPIDVCFIKVGVVIESLNALKKIEASGKYYTHKEIDEEVYTEYSLPSVFPGVGVADASTEIVGQSKFRLELFETMKSLKVDPHGKFKGKNGDLNLLEVFYKIHQGFEDEVRCPVCTKFTPVDLKPVRCLTKGCEEILYYSDLMNLHIGVSEFNEPNFTEIMSALERLLMAGLLFNVKSNENLRKRILFITDGPLALFKATIVEDLLRQLQSMEEAVLVGIEKTGQLADFATSREFKDVLAPGHVAMISNDILRAITGKDSTAYGGGTFYGRRFIYRTLRGDKIFVIAVPPNSKAPYGNDEDAPDNWFYYPTLRKICESLERLQTDKYGTETPAITTISKANDTSSIPKTLGEAMLKKLVEEKVK